MLTKVRLLALLAITLIIVFISEVLMPALMQQLTRQESARIAGITPEITSYSENPQLDINRMMADLQWLAHADREGRRPGTSGGLAARGWLQEQFSALGLQPAGTDGYLQPFSVEAHRDYRRWLRGRNASIPAIDNAANVLGLLPGTSSSAKPIVITAHYDHLGVHEGQIYYGADDNASGVAAMLELARYFRQHPLHHPILFIALDSEERGLQGAVALFKHKLLDARQLAFNINMDMLSRDTGQQLFAVGTYQRPWLLPLIAQVQQHSGVRLIAAHDRPWYKAGYTQNWTLSSDHGIFHQQRVPFIYFGVADHPDYHTPEDTADKVDISFYHQASESILQFILLLDRHLTNNK